MKAVPLIAKRFELTRIIQPQKKQKKRKKIEEHKTRGEEGWVGGKQRYFDWIPLHPYNNNI